MKARLNYARFLASHGKMPRGHGSWAFCPADKYNLPNYLDYVVWSHCKSFADASAEARASFTAQGVTEIVVCP